MVELSELLLIDTTATRLSIGREGPLDMGWMLMDWRPCVCLYVRVYSPEIHKAQYPLDLGRKKTVRYRGSLGLWLAVADTVVTADKLQHSCTPGGQGWQDQVVSHFRCTTGVAASSLITICFSQRCHCTAGSPRRASSSSVIQGPRTPRSSNGCRQCLDGATFRGRGAGHVRPYSTCPSKAHQWQDQGCKPEEHYWTGEGCILRSLYTKQREWGSAEDYQDGGCGGGPVGTPEIQGKEDS